MNNSKILENGVEKVLPSKTAFLELMSKKRVKIYHGIDPSAPEIHLGHAVVLRKLQQFQDLGHQVVLLIGDFTGMIGDPTDRSAARKKLSREQVLANAKTYKDQIGKILRFSGKNKVEVRFNSEWLSRLTFGEVVELASNLTVGQMLERDFFQQRLKRGKPIHLHEFLYPLMQGYDSLALDVDAEIGGTDQTFNMLVGRTLMKKLKGKEKFVISVPLLEGLDGRKMSKSFNNLIGITDSEESMFGKVMTINDSLIEKYFELAVGVSAKKLKEINNSLASGKLHPMEAKKELAWEIVKLHHGEKKADTARKEFELTFQKGSTPKNIPIYKLKGRKANIIDLLVDSKMAGSRSEAKRLIEQGALEWNGKKVEKAELKVESGGVLKVGKYRFLRIDLISN